MQNEISISLIANRAARNYGTNRATEIRFINTDNVIAEICRTHRRPDFTTGPVIKAKVVKFDGYHAESRTGIRASMAALKRFWSTYHYVATVCIVAVPDIDAIYSNDNH